MRDRQGPRAAIRQMVCPHMIPGPLASGRPPRIFTLILLAGLSALGMNLHLPSLAGMAEYYAVDYRVMQLSVALYLAGNAVVQIFVGPISDQMGRRPVILISIVSVPAGHTGLHLCADGGAVPVVPGGADSGGGHHGAEPRRGARHV